MLHHVGSAATGTLAVSDEVPVDVAFNMKKLDLWKPLGLFVSLHPLSQPYFHSAVINTNG